MGDKEAKREKPMRNEEERGGGGREWEMKMRGGKSVGDEEVRGRERESEK